MRHAVQRERKRIELDRYRIADPNKSVVASGDVGLDLKRGPGWNHGDQLIAWLQHGSFGNLCDCEHGGITIGAQFDEPTSQLGLVERLARVIQLASLPR